MMRIKDLQPGRTRPKLASGTKSEGRKAITEMQWFLAMTEKREEIVYYHPYSLIFLLNPGP
jgi:hypothetical protein